jgi:hypothetical protein
VDVIIFAAHGLDREIKWGCSLHLQLLRTFSVASWKGGRQMERARKQAHAGTSLAHPPLITTFLLLLVIQRLNAALSDEGLGLPILIESLFHLHEFHGGDNYFHITLPFQLLPLGWPRRFLLANQAPNR